MLVLSCEQETLGRFSGSVNSYQSWTSLNENGRTGHCKMKAIASEKYSLSEAVFTSVIHEEFNLKNFAQFKVIITVLSRKTQRSIWKCALLILSIRCTLRSTWRCKQSRRLIVNDVQKKTMALDLCFNKKILDIHKAIALQIVTQMTFKQTLSLVEPCWRKETLLFLEGAEFSSGWCT